MIEYESDVRSKAMIPVNLNNYCYVELTQTGFEVFDRAYTPIIPMLRQFGGDKPTPYMTPREAKFLIWELMNMFGPAFFDGQRELPFYKVEMELEDDWDSHLRKRRASTQVIDINDFLFAKLTDDGETILRKAVSNPLIFRRFDGLIEMQFHTLAHIFGPELDIIASLQPLEDLQIYLPKPGAKFS